MGLFVWGKFWKNVLTLRGQYPDKSVLISGKWNKQKNSTNKEIKKLINILIMTNCIQSKEFLESIENIFCHYSNINIFYRPHPSERFMLEEYDVADYIVTNYTSIENDLQNADIVISPVSTAVLDAVNAKIPVIIFHHTKEKGWEEFKKIKGCFYCEKEEEIINSLNELLNLSEVEILNLKKTLYQSSKIFNKNSSYNVSQDIINAISLRYPDNK